jgi:hypothetical protein
MRIQKPAGDRVTELVKQRDDRRKDEARERQRIDQDRRAEAEAEDLQLDLPIRPSPIRSSSMTVGLEDRHTPVRRRLREDHPALLALERAERSRVAALGAVHSVIVRGGLVGWSVFKVSKSQKRGRSLFETLRL